MKPQMSEQERDHHWMLKEAEKIALEIGRLAAELPEKAEDFADSIAEKADAILETIERTGTVTENQMRALINMRDGALKWIERD